VVNPPNLPDGRLRALYAATAAGLDVAGFVVQAIWLLCVFGLTVLAGTIIAPHCTPSSDRRGSWRALCRSDHWIRRDR